MLKGRYDFKKMEEKWRRKWFAREGCGVDLYNVKRPFYNLMMFPYPSAEGLHVGNCFAFIGTDIYGRYKRMCGYDVFEPMGFDAFGIHSENYALKTGKHPKALTEINIDNFKRQLDQLGLMIDRSRMLDTTRPEYYRWTQWIFIKLFEKGLAEKRQAPVNWCPTCKTVLADSQVVEGKCERCDDVIEQRDMKQWFFKIRDYADRLLDNLDDMDWSDVIIKAQRRKIGRSEGARVKFRIPDVNDEIVVFTTRPDTLFGATYVVIAPKHPMVHALTSEEQKGHVREYVEKAKLKTRFERSELQKEKTGVFVGAYAVNPINDMKIPIWISDYVLMDYGAGAIMAVPAHDQRDYEFAVENELPIIDVISPNSESGASKAEAYEGEGIMINSGDYSGMSSEEGGSAIIRWLVENDLGEKAITYRLRDWCVSRQRYWGPPIPIIHCKKCGSVPVPEQDLPVMLPESDDYIPDGSGKSPLARNEEFKRTTCPKCGEEAERETDVSDNFLDSAWYHLRYLSAGLNDKPFDMEAMKRWLPIRSYIGGKEHAEGHLLYFRFITMVLNELRYVPCEEPVSQFRAHGIITKDGVKMSKSKGNVVNPDEYIEKYGTDVLRTYLMFLGPFTLGGDFSDTGIKGCKRFLENVFVFLSGGTNDNAPDYVIRLLNETIEKVTNDIEALAYNTAIAALMAMFNEMRKSDARSVSIVLPFVKMLGPFAPHLAEELWENLTPNFNEVTIFDQVWPVVDKTKMKRDTMVVVVQVNSKLRGKLFLPSALKEEDVKAAALAEESVLSQIEGKKIKKVIYVPNKLVNIVV